MAGPTILDYVLRGLKPIDEWSLPRYLQGAFDLTKNAGEVSEQLEKLAEPLRANPKNPWNYLAFLTAFNFCSRSRKAAFLADKKNKGIKMMVEEDPKGVEAKKRRERYVHRRGANITDSKKMYEIRREYAEITLKENKLQREARALSKEKRNEQARLDEIILADHPELVELRKNYNDIIAKQNGNAEEFRKASELNKEYNERIKKLREETGNIASDLVVKTAAAYDELNKFLKGKKQLKIEARKKMCEEIKEAMIAESSVTEEEADNFVQNSVTIHKSFLEKYPEGTAEVVREEIKTIYRMADGKLDKFTILCDPNYDRSYAEADHINGNKICINLKPDEKTQRIKHDLWHEVGHLLEYYNSEMNELTKEFIKSRATGKLTKLKELNKNIAYEDHEVAYPGIFAYDYIGKWYANRPSSEVISMGLQAICDADDKMLTDLEFMDLVVGLIIGTEKDWHNKYTIRDKIIDLEGNINVMQSAGYTDQKISDTSWQEAIDKAITPKLKRKLLAPKGYKGFGIRENGQVFGMGEDLGKNRFYMEECYRICYLGIALEQNLIPLISKSKLDHLRLLSNIFDEAPDWFFPGMKLPRI